MKRWKFDELMAVVSQFEDVKAFYFAGTLKYEENDDFPKVVDTYETVANGTLERFVPGRHTVVSHGKIYTRVAEQYSPGNAFVESQYIAVYARHDIAKAVVDTLNEAGFYFEVPACLFEKEYEGEWATTVEASYDHDPAYTLFRKASLENCFWNGFVRDNRSDEYLFAQVKDSGLVSEWKEEVPV
jgi:hypothetical protein